MLFHLRCEYGHTHIHHLCSDFFVMQAGMTAVTLQSNKAVLNDIKERMHDQTKEGVGVCHSGRLGTELTYSPDLLKAGFDRHHSLQILHNIFFALIALKRPFTQNG